MHSIQKTIRFNELHRHARTEAVRRGKKVTQLMEKGRRIRLERVQPSPARPLVKLHTYSSPEGFSFTVEEIKAMMDDDNEQLAKLGLKLER